jgi:hypothetical protein
LSNFKENLAWVIIPESGSLFYQNRFLNYNNQKFILDLDTPIPEHLPFYYWEDLVWEWGDRYFERN